MMKWLLVVASAASLFAADPKTDVMAAMESWKQAVLKKDATALEPLLHPDLLYSHSDGRTETKADILKSLPDLGSIKIGESAVRVFGNVVLVKGPMEIVNNATTPPTKLSLYGLQVWVKGATGWQLAGRHSNRMP